MEGGGLGSRQSRASSRYASGGPSSAAQVFNGPVRKWKKQWVSSYGSASATASTNGDDNNNRNTNAHPLYLCRWTPLPSSSSATDEPPKRRFRYAPIVPIKKGNVETLDKVGQEVRTGVRNHQSRSGEDVGDNDGMFEKPSHGDIFSEETQEFSEDQADSNKNFNHALS